MPFRFLTIAACLSYLIIIANMSFQTTTGKIFTDAAGLIPYGDKTLHVVIMAFFSFLLNGWLKLQRVKFVGRSWLLGSLLVALLITIEESSQAFIPARNFEIMDLVCNYAGIYAGGLLSIIILPQQDHKTIGSLNERNTNIPLPTIFHRTR